MPMPDTPKIFTGPDAVFVAVLLSLLGTVWFLGYGSYQEITKVEKVRGTAATFVKWIETAQAQRAAGTAVAPAAKTTMTSRVRMSRREGEGGWLR